MFYVGTIGSDSIQINRLNVMFFNSLKNEKATNGEENKRFAKVDFKMYSNIDNR